MNQAEFNTWLASYCATFPDDAAWISKLPDKDATLTVWCDILENADLEDCKEATRRLATGKEPSIPAYERQSIPRVIATIALRARTGRRIDRRQERLPEYEKYSGSSLGLFAALQKAIKAGASTEDLHKLAESMIPTTPDSPGTPRYRCRLCSDSGSVLVWSNETIHAVMKNAENVPRKRCSIRCSCAANRRWSEEFPIYDPARWCRFTDYDKLDEVKAWCDTYQVAKAERLLGEFCGTDDDAQTTWTF